MTIFCQITLFIKKMLLLFQAFIKETLSNINCNYKISHTSWKDIGVYILTLVIVWSS
jgi:hypothetical protein